MNAHTLRGSLLLAVLSVLAAFGVSYAWQAGRTAPPASAANPADVLGGWLRLLPAQVERLRHVDPAFAEDRKQLEDLLAHEQERLAELFESDGAADDELLAAVERVIAAHDALERRVARYLLAVRPQLSPEQRARLFARCADRVREAGNWRWRRGQQSDETSERRGADPPPDRGFGRGRGRGGNSRPVPPTPATTQPDSRPEGESP